MPTLNQLVRNDRTCRKQKDKMPALEKCPQKKGLVRRVMTVSPKKPNSAQRSVAKIYIPSTKKAITAYIPGEGHNVQEHSVILLRGGGARDLPGVRYSCVRGKFDLQGVTKRMKKRSKYGTKRKKSK